MAPNVGAKGGGGDARAPAGLEAACEAVGLQQRDGVPDDGLVVEHAAHRLYVLGRARGHVAEGWASPFYTRLRLAWAQPVCA